jgi:hypothetical protein
MPIWHYFAIRAFGYASDVCLGIWAHASDLVRDRRAVACLISLVISMLFALYETSAFFNLTSERALAVYADVQDRNADCLGVGLNYNVGILPSPSKDGQRSGFKLVKPFIGATV